MPVETTYPHIEKKADQPAHLKRVPRVRVAQIVMDYLEHGWSPDEMCRQYPHLRPAEAHSAMAYYFDHREEIEREIEVEFDQVRRERASAPPTPVVLRLRAKGLL